MSSIPLPPNEPLLASYMRVLRGKDSLQDLVDAFPTLEQKAFSSPPTLTEIERRQLLDYPDAGEEAENIRQVSLRSRDELMSTVLSDPRTLSDAEIELLEDRFWSPATSQEMHSMVNSSLNRIKESADRIYSAREAAYLPIEDQAYRAAIRESSRRDQQRRDDKQRKFGDPHPPPTPDWMLSLSRRFEEQKNLNTWGYITLFDAEAQTINAERRDLFSSTVSFLFTQAMNSNGARRNLLNRTWKFFTFNAPSTAFVSTELGANNSDLRNAFRDLIDEDKEYLSPQAPDPRHPKEILKNRRGFLTNTFLVIDKTCVDSVLDGPGFVDDMRILAFEADFPQPNRTYIEGYQGWMWVRLEHLVNDFYGARLNEDLGMDVLWQAAQGSKNQAFASLDPKEAKIWTISTMMTGSMPNSIIGRRRMPPPVRQ